MLDVGSAEVRTKGEDAIQQLDTRTDINAVILDVNMPGMGGAATLPPVFRARPPISWGPRPYFQHLRFRTLL